MNLNEPEDWSLMSGKTQELFKKVELILSDPKEVCDWSPESHPAGWVTVEDNSGACEIHIFYGIPNKRDMEWPLQVQKVKISGDIEIDW